MTATFRLFGTGSSTTSSEERRRVFLVFMRRGDESGGEVEGGGEEVGVECFGDEVLAFVARVSELGALGDEPSLVVGLVPGV